MFPNTISLYCDSEEFINGHKKYRSVFRKPECNSFYVDVLLSNTWYFAEKQTANIRLVLQTASELHICEKSVEVDLNGIDGETMASVCFSDACLDVGDYSILVFIDEFSEDIVYFHVIDIPQDYGECFILEDFSFYRRNKGELQTDYRKCSLTSISLDKLEAIDIFFLARNKLPYNWKSEFIVSLFDQTGMLKERQTNTGQPVTGGDSEQFHFFVYFGKEKKSFWRRGDYRIEVVFMNELIIVAPLTIGDKDVETPFNALTVQPRRLHGGKKVIAASMLNIDAIEQINSMIGLDAFKKDLKRYIDRVRYNNVRVQAGYRDNPISLHSIYLGNPGTGKTTVARLMGKAFHQMGLLTKGHVVVEERNSLTGKFYGTEEEKTNQAIERAKGGVLFIDEAYSLLVKDDPKDPGRRIIETLLTTLSDESNRDICIIFAGYTMPMIEMLNDNPGLKSRLPNVYHFDDYSVDEMMQIALAYLRTNEYEITQEAIIALRNTVMQAHRIRDHKFGNGRYIISLLQNEVIQNLASRLIATNEIDLPYRINIIEKIDIPEHKPSFVWDDMLKYLQQNN